MRKDKRLLLFISLFIFIVNTAQKIDKESSNVLPDWRKETINYAKRIIPKEVKNPASQEVFPITLKKVYITKVDNDPVVLAICSVNSENKGTSSLTYFFISPKTNQLASKVQSVLTKEGCDYSIPAFVIKDINGDHKDDFVFLELYDDKCKGDYWISANFHQINPKTIREELDDYLKLRSHTGINRKVKITEAGQLQKRLENVVAELFVR